MKKPLILSVAFLFSTQAYAQENIFSPPNQAEVKQSGGQCQGKPCDDGPGFRGHGGPGGGKWRQMMKSAAPGMREVNMIPSLSPDQRKQVREIFQASRQEVQPLVAQLRELKGKTHGAKGGAGAGPGAGPTQDKSAKDLNLSDKSSANALSLSERKQARQRIFAIAQQIKEKRVAAWQKVKGVLTPEQIQELEKMHQGQIVGPGKGKFEPGQGGQEMPGNGVMDKLNESSN